MGDQWMLAVLIGPLAVLAAIQLIGVRRIVGLDSVKVFVAGMAFAYVAMPLLGLVGVTPVEPGLDALLIHGNRLARIWAIVFGLVLLARIAIGVARWGWDKRPRRVVS